MEKLTELQKYFIANKYIPPKKIKFDEEYKWQIITSIFIIIFSSLFIYDYYSAKIVSNDKILFDEIHKSKNSDLYIIKTENGKSFYYQTNVFKNASKNNKIIISTTSIFQNVTSFCFVSQNCKKQFKPYESIYNYLFLLYVLIIISIIHLIKNLSIKYLISIWILKFIFIFCYFIIFILFK